MERTNSDRVNTVNARPRGRRWALAFAAVIVIGASLLARGVVSGEAEAQPPAAAPGATHRVATADAQLPAGGPPHDVMAIVNGKDVSRATLVQACVERHGRRSPGEPRQQAADPAPLP